MNPIKTLNTLRLLPYLSTTFVGIQTVVRYVSVPASVLVWYNFTTVPCSPPCNTNNSFSCCTCQNGENSNTSKHA